MFLLDAINVLALFYFGALNLTYLVLTIASFARTRRYVARIKSLHVSDLQSAAGGLPISLLVPAFNEEATIVETTRSLLTLRYMEYEIIVVSDGSTDRTIAELTDAFDLHPAHRLPTSAIPTASVRRVLRSRIHPDLWLIDKENGGKADSLNAGLNYSRYPLFCAVDADTLLEPDALIRIAQPFLEDQRTIAAGGMIRIANGCRIEGGAVEEVALPHRLLPKFQVVEYLRAFLMGRIGWDAIGGTLIISGAFGVFRRSIVAAAGGFAIDTVAEDMELVVRLHRHCRENGIPYRISFIPDPVAWTEAPETLQSLGQQRSRWQRGLAQTLTHHIRMMANPRYGSPGVLAFPYHFFLELLGPIVEALGYFSFGLSLALGVASPGFVIGFLLLAVFFGSALSVAAVALEELSFHRYRRGRDLMVLLGLALVETLGYRQLNTVWRLKGIWAFLRGDRDWGSIKRRGFGEKEEIPSPASATGEGEWTDRRFSRATVAEWSERWLRTKAHLKPKTVAGYKSNLRAHVLPTLGGYQLRHVDRIAVEEWVADLQASGFGPSGVRQARQVLNSMMKLAVDTGYLLVNPVADVKVARQPDPEMLFLTAEEVERLAHSIREPYRTLVFLLAYGGLQWGEAAALRRGRCDLLRSRIAVAESLSEARGELHFGPTHRTRVVGIPGFLRDLLAAHLAQHVAEDAEALVFTSPHRTPLRKSNFHRQAWSGAVERAGLPEGLQIRDLRHTCASLLIAAGANPKAVQIHLGHSSITVTMDRYTHLFPSETDALVGRLEDVRARALAAQRRPSDGPRVIGLGER